MTQPDRPFRSFEERDREHLERCEAIWHREVGVAAALHYCAEHRLPAPPWLVERAAEMLCSMLTREKVTKRGRTGGALSRYRQDMIDYVRADAVQETREKQREIRSQVEELKATPNVPMAMLKDREAMLFWAGRDWLRAYECAAMLLTKSEAAGGPDAVKASYLRVQRNSRAGSRRYMSLDPGFLKRVGLGDVAAGDNTTPLPERTL